MSADLVERLLRVGITIAVGLPGAYVLSMLVSRILRRRFSEQAVMLWRKGVFYVCLVALVALILPDLGFKLGPLLGAAGIVGVAVGFASQTSVSNIISGLFLIWEKPFAVTDVITVDGITGIVLSIDLLSVKLRKFDNKYVRIPNETLIKSNVTNITRFPIRRLDVNVSVAYKEDVSKVKTVLMDIAGNNPVCLDEPPPLFIFLNFGDSGLEFLFAVWFEKADYLELKSSIMQQIKERFDEEGIEIPFPHITLYRGAATDPFPIQITDADGQDVRDVAGLTAAGEPDGNEGNAQHT